ncbi:MAG: restriction endonuclease subunit S [Anaerolineales bacterium]|nr:restriction endonuclease subunit S [Anaerolineales bacterium]
MQELPQVFGLVEGLPNGIGAGSTEYFVCRPIKELLHPKYLLAFFKTTKFLKDGANVMQGAVGQQRVPKQYVLEHEIPLPPLPEQKRIADKLDALLARADSCERHLERVPQILKRFRQSVLAAATSGRLTEEWREEKGVKNSANDLLQVIANAQNEASIKVRGGAIEPSLGDLPDEVELSQGWAVAGFDFLASPEPNALKAGPFGSTLKKNMYVPDGYKIYGQEQVIAGDENFGDYYIDETKYQELITCAVKPGDILISLVGTIGKVLVLSDNSKPGIINPRLVKLSLYKSINRKYISLYLQSPLARHFFESKSHGGTMDILNLGILRELPVLIPTIEEQTEIVRRVEKLFVYAERLEARYLSASERVGRFTPSLLAKAFRGELVGQDPNDESASILLERIREAREAGKTNATGKKPSRKKDRTAKAQSQR